MSSGNRSIQVSRNFSRNLLAKLICIFKKVNVNDDVSFIITSNLKYPGLRCILLLLKTLFTDPNQYSLDPVTHARPVDFYIGL